MCLAFSHAILAVCVVEPFWRDILLSRNLLSDVNVIIVYDAIAEVMCILYKSRFEKGIKHCRNVKEELLVV